MRSYLSADRWAYVPVGVRQEEDDLLVLTTSSELGQGEATLLLLELVQDVHAVAAMVCELVASMPEEW